MVMARWTATVQDAEGNAVPGCEIEVRNANTGLLTQVYSDRDGTVPLGNPFVSADATFGFHVVGGAYRITARKGAFTALWNYVGIGTMGEFDFESIAFELEAGLYPVATLADLNAYVPGAEQSIAGIVLNDPDPSNNGYYLWSGTAWEWQRGLPDTIARLTVIGGTENALEVQASEGVDPGSVLAFFIDPLTPNTGPVTIKINGDDPVPAYDYAGEDFVPGAFSGRVFLTREQDGSLRSINPADLAARAAQSASEAEADADRAETYAAMLSVDRIKFNNVPALLADTSMGYAGSGASIIVGPGDRIEADDFPYDILASDAVTPIETAGLVKLNLMSHVWRPAAYGIFSDPSLTDHRAELQVFVNDAAAAGATIEWGSLDIYFDAHSGVYPNRGLLIPSHSHWVCHPDTRFRALPNGAGSYEILHLHNVTDIVIEGNGARCVGERSQHTGATGEWGMGVSIRGTANVMVSDLGADDCWGDGFYIGSTPEQAFCQDTILLRPFGDNNRRQGLSLISARGFLCEDSYFSNVNGVAPAWGIDVEPNSPDEFLEDVKFIRPASFNCVSGFGMYLTSMGGSDNSVDVLVLDPRDEGSRVGHHFACATAVKGLVRVVTPYSRNAKSNGIEARAWAAIGPRLEIVELKVRNANRDLSSGQVFGAGVAVHTQSGDPAPSALGNVHIYRPDIGNDPGVPNAMTNSIIFLDSSNPTRDWQNVTLDNPVSLGNTKAWFPRGQLVARDKMRVSVKQLSALSETIGRSDAAVHYVAGSHTGTVTKDLPDDYPIGADIVIENEAAFTLNVRFPSGHALNPVGSFTNRIIGTNQPGARIKLRRISPTGWRIIEQVGTWTTG